jgi:hypothetical protein
MICKLMMRPIYRLQFPSGMTTGISQSPKAKTMVQFDRVHTYHIIYETQIYSKPVIIT